MSGYSLKFESVILDCAANFFRLQLDFRFHLFLKTCSEAMLMRFYGVRNSKNRPLRF